MADWLNGALPTEGELPSALLALRLLTAAALGAGVAAVYYLTRRKTRAAAGPFVATLVLLTVLLAMVTLVIGNNVARAFGLVGALSIVRFRTVVDDTRDTAFVIFAVVIGMAVGAGQLGLALVGLPIVGGAAWVLSAWGREPGGPAGPATLVVRLGIGLDPEAVLGGVLGRHLAEYRLVSTGTARQGAALELTYRATLRADASSIALLGELNRVEGVQGVEWKETV
jgi:hypothetical protein